TRRRRHPHARLREPRPTKQLQVGKTWRNRMHAHMSACPAHRISRRISVPARHRYLWRCSPANSDRGKSMPYPCNRSSRRTAAIAPIGQYSLSRAAPHWSRLLLTAVIFFMPAASWALPRIAVVDFDTNQYSSQIAGDQLADYVIDELVNTGLFDVVEREKMASITRELGFGASGLVDPSSAAQMGRLA